MKLQTYIFFVIAIAGTFLYNWYENQKSQEEIKRYKIEASRIMAIDSLHSLQERKIRNILDSIKIQNKRLTDSLFLEIEVIERNEWRLKRDIQKLEKELEHLPDL